MFLGIIKKMFKIVKEIYPKSTFKVVGINGEPQNKNTRIIYQVSGKATIAAEKPNILVQELMHINGFSKDDADLIYNLAIEEKLSHSFRIVSIQFLNEPIKFEIEDVYSKHTLLLTAEEIVSSNKILEKFSSNDSMIIYFQILKENQKTQKSLKNKLLYKSQCETRKGIFLLKNMEANE